MYLSHSVTIKYEKPHIVRHFLASWDCPSSSSPDGAFRSYPFLSNSVFNADVVTHRSVIFSCISLILSHTCLVSHHLCSCWLPDPSGMSTRLQTSLCAQSHPLHDCLCVGSHGSGLWHFHRARLGKVDRQMRRSIPKHTHQPFGVWVSAVLCLCDTDRIQGPEPTVLPLGKESGGIPPLLAPLTSPRAHSPHPDKKQEKY